MTAYTASRSQQSSASSVLPLVVLFTFALSASIPLFAQAGGTYYVSTSGSDHNPGTFAKHWLTIQHAANIAMAGATVYVLGGVYKQSITFPNSGTKSEPITFTSYPGQTAIIDGTGLKPSGVQGLINIRA